MTFNCILSFILIYSVLILYILICIVYFIMYSALEHVLHMYRALNKFGIIIIIIYLDIFPGPKGVRSHCRDHCNSLYPVVVIEFYSMS